MRSGIQDLIQKLRKGDRKAMEAFYNDWAPLLFGVALRYCNSREEAEDMLHEALLKIIKGLDNFEPAFEGAFEAWMRRIVVNQCLTSLRKKTDFRLNGYLRDEDADEFIEVTEDEEWPEISQEDILKMINQLPPGYKMVLNLYVFEKMAHKDIALQLNISENTSKSQLSKARSMMKRMLHDHLQHEEIKR